MAIPINKVAGPDSPQQAMHFLTQGHDVPVDSSEVRSLSTSLEWRATGEAVTGAELEACAEKQNVTLGEGDILVLRTGHHRRRLKLGPWDNPTASASKLSACLCAQAL